MSKSTSKRMWSCWSPLSHEHYSTTPTLQWLRLSRTYTLRASARPEQPVTRKRGGFTPRQQAVYRKLVDLAWRAVADDIRDQVAKGRWYRETLRDSLGVFTSKQLNKTGDFEKACAAFEEIAGADIYWQLRVTAGPIERARRELSHLSRQHDIEESYIAGIARQMFKTHTTNLNAGQLNDIIVALKKHFGPKTEAIA